MWEEKQRIQLLVVICMAPGGLAIRHKGRSCGQRASEVFADVDFFCGSCTVGRPFSGYFNGFSFTLNGYKNMLKKLYYDTDAMGICNSKLLVTRGRHCFQLNPKGDRHSLQPIHVQ